MSDEKSQSMQGRVTLSGRIGLSGQIAITKLFAVVSCLLVCGLTSLAACQEREKLEYSKTEHRIPMRDGVTLYTVVYSPTNVDESYPILFQRTPYGCWPYGETMPPQVMYNPDMVQSGYIFVYQDLRSRSMSDGAPVFDNLKPSLSLQDPNHIDEVTDACDSIDWLVTNVPNHNGRVGTFGSSYMGFTSLMAAASKHPKIHASLVAAPSVDIYFEDFNRNGLFTLAYTPILDWFGTPKHKRHEGPWWENQLDFWADGKRFGLAKDSYQYFLDVGSLKNLNALIPDENYFWKQICEHPDYDEYRKSRNALQYLNSIESPVLLVGGLNDEQNLYGIFKTWETIKRDCGDCEARFYVGPWTHGDHKKRTETRVGDIYYGNNLVEQYQKKVEFRFFEKHLKEKPEFVIPQITVHDSGTGVVNEFSEWPPANLENVKFFLHPDESLTKEAYRGTKNFEFVSDPFKPVPYVENDEFSLFPSKSFMTSDQRFASKRPDVLTFVSEPLQNAVRMSGPGNAHLRFSTNGTDADLIVKLIDVYPMNRKPAESDTPGVKMNGYQQLVRCGQIRARYREGYETSKPFRPSEVTDVDVQLLDCCHTFKKGHQIMVQIQSSLFPLFDRNPQTFVENIYRADDADFSKSIHQLHPGSWIEIPLRHDED